jgi:hypothetical protein
LADSLEFAHSTIAIKRGGLSGNLRNLLIGERASERETKVPSLLRGRERAGRRRKKGNNKGEIENKRARERKEFVFRRTSIARDEKQWSAGEETKRRTEPPAGITHRQPQRLAVP